MLLDKNSRLCYTPQGLVRNVPDDCVYEQYVVRIRNRIIISMKISIEYVNCVFEQR